MGTSNAGGTQNSQFSANISIYLGNNTRQIYCYYGMQVRNHIQALELYHFQWPWKTPNPDFKVMQLFDAECVGNGTTQRYGIVTME